MNDLVSIIMLSHNNGQYVEESVRSVMAQTYTNWELIVVDDNSQDGTIAKMMELRDEDSRIKISQAVYDRGASVNRNAALKDARGRWIAFLDVGDVWHPTKLERQIAFMEENGYAFSYTGYGLMDMESRSRGVVISGKAHVTHEDMMRCCWPAYLTVMYDAEKVGRLQLRNLEGNNDYALWLMACEEAVCHLLKENLAKLRTKWSIFGKVLLTKGVKWRYEVYRIEYRMNPVVSCLYTIRNMWYGVVKWMKYVERV